MITFKIYKLLIFTFFVLFFPTTAFAENLRLKSFGHSSFLIMGGSQSILLNPFKSIGCTAGLDEINNEKFDFILASSRLSDEGYNPNNELIFVEPGVYKINQLILNGIQMPHDRYDGKRFGMATVWIWVQNNFKIVHMGGAAGRMDINDNILLSRPDILFISVGGGPKSYNGREAADIVKVLKPKIIIPVHFLNENNKNFECEFSNEDLFLKSIRGFKVQYVGKTFEIKQKNLRENTIYIVK
tara:strand:+ start:220 stop:945 length:726 start_codon:yes stop_codon:yes gene_type:complete